MTGEVDDRSTPILRLEIGGEEWIAVIDTGFNGHLVLPQSLADLFPGSFYAETEIVLGDGQIVVEELFTIDFPFDGVIRSIQTSFVDTNEILIGTLLLEDHRLEVNFVTRTVELENLRS